MTPFTLPRRALLAGAATLAAPAILRAQTVQKLTFYYPIAVGGPIAAIIDGYCTAYQKETGVEVSPVFAGDYGETLTKAVTAIRGGAGPQFAVLLAAEIHSLQQMDILVPVDDLGLDADAKKWLDGFYPAFLANSHADGKTWSVPFQRSTLIAFYNKTAFQQAGLDPEKFPKTWQEQGEAAQKLVQRDGSGRVTRWGIKIAGDLGNAQWTFGALANQNDHKLMNDAGTQVFFDHPKAIEALAYWQSLDTRLQGNAHRRLGLAHPGARFPRGQHRDHLDHHRQPHQHPRQGRASLSRSPACPDTPRRTPSSAAAIIYFFKNASDAERTASPPLRALAQHTRTCRRLVDAHRLHRDAARRL